MYSIKTQITNMKYNIKIITLADMITNSGYHNSRHTETNSGTQNRSGSEGDTVNKWHHVRLCQSSLQLLYMIQYQQYHCWPLTEIK